MAPPDPPDAPITNSHPRPKRSTSLSSTKDTICTLRSRTLTALTPIHAKGTHSFSPTHKAPPQPPPVTLKENSDSIETLPKPPPTPKPQQKPFSQPHQDNSPPKNERILSQHIIHAHPSPPKPPPQPHTFSQPTSGETEVWGLPVRKSTSSTATITISRAREQIKATRRNAKSKEDEQMMPRLVKVPITHGFSGWVCCRCGGKRWFDIRCLCGQGTVEDREGGHWRCKGCRERGWWEGEKKLLVDD
ncbi:hypothetical protein N7G274_009695 [Stereocaulon virgatum]|uniref:Uncharacterized protein n=1 Tax=Stereocaulon virgatum TaxID=373712 RepID=A0ABR3ZVF0_9LECA